jgi:hypothetical protein
MSFDVFLKNQVGISSAKFRAAQEEIENKYLISGKNLIDSKELVKLVTSTIFNSYFSSNYNVIPKNVTKKIIKYYFRELIREERKAETLRLLKKVEDTGDSNEKLEKIEVKIKNGKDATEELNMGFERPIEESNYEKVKICNQWSKIFISNTKDREIQKELDNARAQLNQVKEQKDKLISFIFF